LTAVLLAARQQKRDDDDNDGGEDATTTGARATKRKRPKKAKKSVAEQPPEAAPPEKEEASATAAFGVGDRVEALWQNESWHPGSVTGVKPLGAGRFSYAVAYDDGESETRLDPDRLRRHAPKEEAPVVEQPTNATAAPDRAADNATAAPDLAACVAYRKDGLADVVPASDDVSKARRRLDRKVANLVKKETPAEDDDDDDLFEVPVVQSESEWRAAAPKPRKPKVDKKPAPKPAATASSESNTEKNRKKREKQKANKLAVREALRNA